MTPWIEAHKDSLSFSISLSLLKLLSIESVMPSNYLILCHLLLLLSLVFSSIKVFSKELTLHIRWPKYWSFSFSIGPSNVCSGLISFRINWFDLFAVQGTPKSRLPLPLKPLTLHPSAFFTFTYTYYVNMYRMIVYVSVCFVNHGSMRSSVAHWVACGRRDERRGREGEENEYCII